MEKLEQQKNKYGSIVFGASHLLHAVFTVCIFAGMGYMLIRITQQDHEISNLKTMLYQLRHPHIKNNIPIPIAEGINKRQEFQEITEFVNQDENAVQSLKEKPEISRMRKKRASRSSCSGVNGSFSGGIVMLNESAHVIGEGNKKKKPVTKIKSNFIMTSWKKKYASGHMSYSNGSLTVGLKGYYYIYSQINYNDNIASSGYEIYIDETPVIKNLHSVVSDVRKVETSYAGGVFYMCSGQRISVRTPYQQIFYFGATRSFFGAFMVHQ